jgi:hypothetical protein
LCKVSLKRQWHATHISRRNPRKGENMTKAKSLSEVMADNG